MPQQQEAQSWCAASHLQVEGDDGVAALAAVATLHHSLRPATLPRLRRTALFSMSGLSVGDTLHTMHGLRSFQQASRNCMNGRTA